MRTTPVMKAIWLCRLVHPLRAIALKPSLGPSHPYVDFTLGKSTHWSAGISAGRDAGAPTRLLSISRHCFVVAQRQYFATSVLDAIALSIRDGWGFRSGRLCYLRRPLSSRLAFISSSVGVWDGTPPSGTSRPAVHTMAFSTRVRKLSSFQFR
jgi:hypothetical protein